MKAFIWSSLVRVVVVGVSPRAIGDVLPAPVVVPPAPLPDAPGSEGPPRAASFAGLGLTLLRLLAA